jgi:hypothetical protein
MSRGCGELQQLLFAFVVKAEKPMSCAELIAQALQYIGVNDPTHKLRPDRERAIRRALKGLCDRNLISTLGTGRPGDPYRYTPHLTCVMCREAIPDEQGGLTHPRTGASICFKCAGLVVRGYSQIVLPKQLAERAEAKETKVPALPEITHG